MVTLHQREQQDEQQHRRESWTVNGWNIGQDDDCPRPPELSPLDSAQSRRAWRPELN
jgi:hypothetical protein